jgi:GNAT superfamily N-acetyltransferase
MGDPVICPLTFDDVDDALRLSTVVGWNQRRDDWRMLLRLAPAGAFAALLDARIVGTAIGIDYGGFAWIAMMLVDPAYRGRGLGRRLLEAAMAAVPSNLPIRLDATPLGRPLYQQYGFDDEATLGRHVIDHARLADQPAARRPPSPSALGPLTAADLAVVIEQDREIFGGARSGVLEWAFHDAPHYAHLARNDDGVIDYCLGRPGRLFDQIGPVVAGDDDTAHALVRAALAAAGDRPVVVDAFDPATGSASCGDSSSVFAAALRDEGFVVQRPLVRMCRRPGACTDRDAYPTRSRNAPAYVTNALESRPRRRAKEFAIFGPEFA